MLPCPPPLRDRSPGTCAGGGVYKGGSKSHRTSNHTPMAPAPRHGDANALVDLWNVHTLSSVAHLRGAEVDEGALINATSSYVLHLASNQSPEGILGPVIRYAMEPTTPEGVECRLLPLHGAQLCEVVAAMLDLRVVKGDEVASSDAEIDRDALGRIRREYTFADSEQRVAQPRAPPRYALERQNWHERDARIVFDDLSHRYYLDGTRRFEGSVSSAYGAYFGKFDGAECVRKNWNRPYRGWEHNAESPYNPLVRLLRACFSEDDGMLERALARVMLHMWQAKNLQERASEKGTAMHEAIEMLLNGVPVADPQFLSLLSMDGETTLPMDQFGDFTRRVQESEGLTPYRTEWSVWDDDSMLSGQIDSVFIGPDGALHMVDWKRSKHLDLGPDMPHYKRWGAPPCERLPDNDFGKYSMQQNLYACILEANYGLEVRSMRLAHFHPTLEGGRCRVIDVPDRRAEAREILRLRSAEREQAQSKRQKTRADQE